MKTTSLFFAMLFGFFLTQTAQANSIADHQPMVPPSTSWTSGSLMSFYLDFAHTQKTFNNISLAPGRYKYTLQTKARNNKPGKVNFDVHVVYASGSPQKKVDIVANPTGVRTGYLNIDDYRSQSGGSNAGYGKVKVHIGRVAHNTNVNYKITLTKVGALPGGTSGSGGGTGGTTGAPCTYSSLGSKTGNVVGNTVGKYTSTKKICKNQATVRVVKTGGKARTTILVYTRNSPNGPKQLVQSQEFPNGRAKGSKTIRINNRKGKFVHVEVKNRSAANTFQYNLSITQ